MKLHSLTLVVLFFVMVMNSCKSKTPETKQTIIAIIPKVDNAIFDQVKQSSIEAAKDLGIVVTWEAPTSINGEKQKELIENLIHYKVDGILISCNDAEMLKQPINDAIKAGIKVATFDSDCPTSDRQFYIGTDNRKAGEICAETMKKLYEKAGKTPDQIMILSGGPSALNLKQRVEGFVHVMGVKNISEVLYSFEMPDYGRDIVSICLSKNPRINGLQMVLGVSFFNGIDSIPEMKKFLKNGGVAVFFDESKPLLRDIIKYPNCATIVQNFRTMGYDGVKKLYEAIQGKDVQKQIFLDVKVVDQSNAKKELEQF